MASKSGKSVKVLKAKRGQILNKLKKLQDLGRNVDDADLRRFLVQCEEIPQMRKEFVDIMDLLCEASKEEDVDYSMLDIVEDMCIDLQVMKEDLQEKRRSQQVKNETKHVPVRRLPDIPLPQFSGEPTAWPLFKESFESLIHSNSVISDIEKMHYLIGSLSGKALSICQGIPPTGENYEIVWRALVEKYDDVRVTAHAYVERILNFKPMTQENHQSLSFFIENFNSTVEAFKKLKISDLGDYMLAHVALSKLPVETRRALENVKRDASIISYKEIIEFVKGQNKICLRELPVEQTKISVKPSGGFKSKIFQNFYINETEGSKCNLCLGVSHVLSKCPRFLQMTVNKRLEYVKENRKCYNCFASHTVRKCPCKYVCQICKRRHHTLIHVRGDSTKTSLPSDREKGSRKDSNPTTSSEVPEGQTEVVSMMGSCIINEKQVCKRNIVNILPTVTVFVRDGKDVPRKCRFLLDSGSQSNFITKKCASRLRLQIRRCEVEVRGLGAAGARALGCLTITFSPHFDVEKRFTVQSIIVERIVDKVPTIPIDKGELSCLEGIRLADPEFFLPKEIDGILGVEVFMKSLKWNRISDARGEPIALESELGYVVMGSVPVVGEEVTNTKVSHALCTTTEDPMTSLIEKFWENEDLPDSCVSSSEEDECEKLFAQGCSRTGSGRYMVKLPFKMNPSALGESFQNAYRRFLALEKRFRNDPLLKERYNKVMEDYLQQSHMSLWKNAKDHGGEYYIPHHGVVKIESASTPLRVVFDASCKSGSSYSLNDILHSGRKLQVDICTILLNFRCRKIAFTADIKQMYRQILLHPEHRTFQKILWRSSPQERLRTYCLNTVTFGVKSSPYLALRVLQQLAEDERSKFPEAAGVIERDMYVDDLVSGADTFEDAARLVNDVNKLFYGAGFQLVKWSTNSLELKNKIPVDKCYNQVVDFDEHSIKVLGMLWNPELDMFCFSPKMADAMCTKRNILSTVARCYDPLGLVSPVMLFAKLLVKQLWSLNIGWDETPPSDLVARWKTFYEELPRIASLQIPRFLNVHNDSIVTLIGFADACLGSYGAAIYMRTESPNRQIAVNLIYAKSKVAPMRPITIPRLELLSAQLLAKMFRIVSLSYFNRVSINKIYAFVDSVIVLNWLQKDPSQLEQFVANRISYIKDIVPEEAWWHVPTKENIADILSRGQTPSQFLRNEYWFNGPDWLKLENSRWPVKRILKGKVGMQEPRVSLVSVQIEENIIVKLAEKQSDLSKLIRIIVYVLRFIRVLPSRKPLSVEDLNTAELFLVRQIQRNYFKTEINLLERGICPVNLSHLRPFMLDSIIRVGGRLQNSTLGFDQRHPILLPKKGHFVQLIIDHYHRNNLHTGPQLTLSLIRQKYWILSARNLVRFRIKKCVLCFRSRPKVAPPVMGNLPMGRVQEAKAFLRTGVDYAGPIMIVPYRKRGVRSVKAYICLFVCLATKAIHLEVATDLSAESFLRAFSRFIGRRGEVQEMFSDNGANFIGAKAKLEDLHAFILSENFSEVISNGLVSKGIKWHLIPPQAPHMGGLWESQVRAVKTHLFKGIGSQLLTYEELYTVLVQIEALLNSRPLCALSTDPADPSPLTPAHFLTLGPMGDTPMWCDNGKILSGLERFALINQIVKYFWKRWSVEYLNTLQVRNRWHKDEPQVKVGDVVLLHFENLAPRQWPLGVIEDVHPGKDNITRVVTVRAKGGVYKRPVTKVYPLPTH